MNVINVSRSRNISDLSRLAKKGCFVVTNCIVDLDLIEFHKKKPRLSNVELNISRCNC